MNEILKHFELTDIQKKQFSDLETVYKDWNSKINVVSRKDIDEIYTRHVLHSLAIAKVQSFLPNSDILDIGTGGGFPGIPLAILFPECNFHLVDSIAKKIKVVSEVSKFLNLKNVKSEQIRAENITEKYDFIVSRAVTAMPKFMSWTKGKIKKNSKHQLKNGILYLKGGNLTEELKNYPNATIFEINEFFENEFFETKKVVHLRVK